MGEEKLDNTVYTIRGLFDLADMARAKHDTATATWARDHGARPALALRGRLVVPSRPRSTPTRWTIRATSRSSRSTGSASRRWRPSSRAAGRPTPAWRAASTGRPRSIGREDPCYSGTRPYNPGLFHTGCGARAGEGEGRTLDLRPQHRDPVGRRGQLRPARGAEALHGRRGRADVRRALHRRRRGASHPRDARRAARRLAGDLPVAGLRRDGPARRERGALHPLPLDGRAGVEPVRDDLAGRPPAARRAARPRSRPADDRAAAAVEGADRRRGHPARRRPARSRPRLAARRPVHDDGRRPCACRRRACESVTRCRTAPPSAAWSSTVGGAAYKARETNRGVEVTVRADAGRHEVVVRGS